MFISIITLMAIIGGISAIVYTSRLKKSGKLTEKMTAKDTATMAGAAVHIIRPLEYAQKSFGDKKTLISVSENASLSWGEIFEAIKAGNVKKLWPLFFVIGIFLFVGFIFWMVLF